MSELKAYTAYSVYNRAHNLEESLVYLKPEVDNVIAELEKKLKNSRNARKYWRQEFTFEYNECLHNKFKRCLAMASYWLAVYYQCVDDKHRQSAERHHRKWLELASKFKESK